MSNPTKNFIVIVILGLAAFMLGAFVGQSSEAEAQQPSDPNAYCNAMARLSETAAEARDRGVPISAVGVVVGQIADPHQRRDAISVIQLAYTEPHLPPEQEAGIVFELCWATYGGE